MLVYADADAPFGRKRTRPATAKPLLWRGFILAIGYGYLLADAPQSGSLQVEDSERTHLRVGSYK